MQPTEVSAGSSTPLAFGPQTVTSLTAGATREWLVTDGLGGYAMGTVSGLRTRRYHGLLVVAGRTPARRHLGLAALDPVLTLPTGARVRLGVHEWADGTVAPTGHELLESFELRDGVPRWRWRVGSVVLEREVAMHSGYAGVAVVHRLVAGGPVRLELEALTTWRDVHGERTASGPAPTTEPAADGVIVEGAYRLHGPGWEPAGEWYRGVQAREEAARGLAAVEDLWLAGRFVADLAGVGESVGVSAWGSDLSTAPPPAEDVVAGARSRAARLVAGAAATDAIDSQLVLAADAFITVAPDVVAGYPWFGCWSRDTMTSYEGLFLETGRHDEGRRLLTAYADTISAGMLANTADTGQTEFNTADATLWFLHAVDRHVARAHDPDLGAALLPRLLDVVRSHVDGTRYGIRVDDDGLLTQGEPGFALTWMDARVDGVGVTPRIGKAVEINALWVNGLAALRRLQSRVTHATGAEVDVDALERAARRSFVARFPTGAGHLYDVVDGPAGDDATVRPNQLLAVGLPDAPFGDGTGAAARIVESCAPLLTPVGLRSLSPADPRFTGRHRGGPAHRDAAYHQGTVWPWLVGPYVDAAVAAGAPADVLAGLAGHLADWGVGSVSETADGAAPHDSSGCPFQAWSVAEVLRARRRIVSTTPRSRRD